MVKKLILIALLFCSLASTAQERPPKQELRPVAFNDLAIFLDALVFGNDTVPATELENLIGDYLLGNLGGSGNFSSTDSTRLDSLWTSYLSGEIVRQAVLASLLSAYYTADELNTMLSEKLDAGALPDSLATLNLQRVIENGGQYVANAALTNKSDVVNQVSTIVSYEHTAAGNNSTQHAGQNNYTRTWNGSDSTEFYQNYDGTIDVLANGIGAMMYKRDYSGNYMPRSLVDKAYVDSQVGVIDSSWKNIEITESILMSDETESGKIYTAPNANGKVYISAYDVNNSTYRDLILAASHATEPQLYLLNAYIQGPQSNGNFSYLNFDFTGTSSNADALFDFNQSANRTYTWPDKSGTVAMTSDIVGGGTPDSSWRNIEVSDEAVIDSLKVSGGYISLDGTAGYYGNGLDYSGGEIRIKQSGTVIAQFDNAGINFNRAISMGTNNIVVGQMALNGSSNQIYRGSWTNMKIDFGAGAEPIGGARNLVLQSGADGYTYNGAILNVIGTNSNGDVTVLEIDSTGLLVDGGIYMNEVSNGLYFDANDYFRGTGTSIRGYVNGNQELELSNDWLSLNTNGLRVQTGNRLTIDATEAQLMNSALTVGADSSINAHNVTFNRTSSTLSSSDFGKEHVIGTNSTITISEATASGLQPGDKVSLIRNGVTLTVDASNVTFKLPDGTTTTTLTVTKAYTIYYESTNTFLCIGI